MNIINYFKKILKSQLVSEQERKTERISFNKIRIWIADKEKEIKEKEKNIHQSINYHAEILITELNEKIKNLENVDLESKNINNRTKTIAIANLNNYKEHLKNLIKQLKNLNQKNLVKFVDDINDILNKFNEDSHMNYQKAVYFIGKEIAEIKDSLSKFFRDFKKITKKNKSNIDLLKKILFTNLKLKEIDEIDSTLKNIDKGFNAIDNDIKILKQKIKKIPAEIEEIKSEKSYIENLKNIEKEKTYEKELKTDMQNLRQMIHFKALANIFHVSAKNMNIIKDYKNNFNESFQRDKGASILNLLDESKLNNKNITDKINIINEKTQKISNIRKKVKKDKTETLSKEIKDLESQIEKLKNQKNKELKRNEKSKSIKKQLIHSIKQELAKINIILIGSKKK